MQTDAQQRAIEKAKAKRAATVAIGGLSLADKLDVLADLQLEIEGLPEPTGAPSKAEKKTATPARVRVRKSTPGKRAAVVGAKRGRGRQKGTPRDTGKTEAIYKTLQANPRMSIADITKIVQPEDPEATHKVRALIFSLKGRGRLKNVGTGEYEVVPRT